jgi:ABC-type sugar transport system ATPase subunit
VYLIERLGEGTIVDLEIGDRLVKMRTADVVHAREGTDVRVSFAEDAIHLFDPATGLRRHV